MSEQLLVAVYRFRSAIERVRSPIHRFDEWERACRQLGREQQRYLKDAFSQDDLDARKTNYIVQARVETEKAAADELVALFPVCEAVFDARLVQTIDGLRQQLYSISIDAFSYAHARAENREKYRHLFERSLPNTPPNEFDVAFAKRIAAIENILRAEINISAGQ